MGRVAYGTAVPGSETRGRFYGKGGSCAIILALQNPSHCFWAVSVVPTAKAGVVGFVKGARLRRQGAGWKDPAEQP